MFVQYFVQYYVAIMSRGRAVAVPATQPQAQARRTCHSLRLF
jgi:hypothetical protein